MNDQHYAEKRVEDALYFLRSESKGASPYQIEKNKKIVRNEIAFLKSTFPDSYILEEDISDIDL